MEVNIMNDRLYVAADTALNNNLTKKTFLSIEM